MSRGGLAGGRKLAVLALPWVFLALLAVIYLRVLWPQVTGGHLLAACVGVIAGLVFVSFSVAAVTFSRDVLSGRYPPAAPEQASARPWFGHRR